MYWIITLSTLFLVVGIFSYSFYKKWQSHKRACQSLQRSLYEPIRKNDHDYSIFFPPGLMLGEYLWKIYTIDSTVIKAVDFSSVEDLDSSYAVAEYLMTNMLEQDEASFAGFRNRLIGYMGEQRVAEVLAEEGKNAVWASTSNQELWDLQINDQLANVKTVLDVNSIKETAIAHPDVLYIVPEDTYKDIGIDNMQPLNGFNHQEIQADLDEAYEHIDGSGAFDAFSSHLPIGSGITAINQRKRMLQAGGDESAINKNVAIDFATKTSSSLVMAKLGGLVGAGLGSLIFMPVAGGILGAALGAFWGAKKGTEFGKKIKELELQKQKLKLKSLLQSFGEKYFPYIGKIKSQIYFQCEQNRRSLESFEENLPTIPISPSWKNKLFKDKNHIFYQELRIFGEQAYTKEKFKADHCCVIYNEIEDTQNAHALALTILNNVHLRDFLHIDLIELKKIYAQKNRTYMERYKLYPDQFPLTEKLKNHRKLDEVEIKKTA